MHRILFEIAGFKVYSYGFMIALGFLVALVFSVRESKEKGFGSFLMQDLFFWSVLIGFLGARIVYIIIQWQYFLLYPFELLFSKGGFVFYGGFIFGLLAAIIFLRIKRIAFYPVADIVMPYIVLAHAFGRLGCFLNGCCYGVPTTAFYGVRFPADCAAGQIAGKLVPVQLVSVFVLLVIFWVLTALKKKVNTEGLIFWLYVFLYSSARFLLEFIRYDDRGTIGIFSVSQVFAICFIVVSIFMFFRLKKNTKSHSNNV
ncbi:MAG: prolipoprotein diacylglyceryl transferase [Candidatus Gygaella obscura]|nr:prolipoprotein diacylglyceryl transferase [Candidatus Gygaella obscura]